MRRAILLTVVVITSLVLQTTVFAKITLLEARPELMYLLAIVFAMTEGPASGATVGFIGGMAQDFLLNTQPKGITALTLTLLGYAIGMARQYIVSPSAVLPVVLVALGTFGGVLFHGVVSFLLGQLDTGWLYQFRTAALAGVYNAILTPLLYPILRRAAEGSRSQRVIRW